MNERVRPEVDRLLLAEQSCNPELVTAAVAARLQPVAAGLEPAPGWPFELPDELVDAAVAAVMPGGLTKAMAVCAAQARRWPDRPGVARRYATGVAEAAGMHAAGRWDADEVVQLVELLVEVADQTGQLLLPAGAQLLAGAARWTAVAACWALGSIR